MRKPAVEKNITKQRRASLAKKMEKSSALVLVSHPEYTRNSDVHHSYRADSNMVYFTGFEEPDSVLIFRPGMKPETIMFVRKKDVLKETWDGFRFGIDLTQSEFGIDKCYNIEDLESELPKILGTAENIYYKLDCNTEFDEIFNESVEHLNKNSNKELVIKDSYELIAPFRLIKDEHAITQMRAAAKASAVAQVEVMKAMKPGVGEKFLQGVFIQSIMAQGATREAYGSIMATGNNATTLHYVFNDDTCKDGDLFLIDAGAEINYHAGDITRTYPVNGKFNGAQKRIYSAVLELQKQLITMAVVGSSFKAINEACDKSLIEIMISEKLLTGTVEEIFENKEYRKYYAHSVGHGLGMDVHDVGFGRTKDKSQKFEAGMCITIEPGIYIPADDTTAPEELRGIGIRIEDDIHITANGPENMTELVPKEIDEMEALIGSGY